MTAFFCFYNFSKNYICYLEEKVIQYKPNKCSAGGENMKTKQYLCIDLNNAESKVMPILSKKLFSQYNFS